jgi:hypothetical protein
VLPLWLFWTFPLRGKPPSCTSSASIEVEGVIIPALYMVCKFMVFLNRITVKVDWCCSAALLIILFVLLFFQEKCETTVVLCFLLLLPQAVIDDDDGTLRWGSVQQQVHQSVGEERRRKTARQQQHGTTAGHSWMVAEKSGFPPTKLWMYD